MFLQLVKPDRFTTKSTGGAPDTIFRSPIDERATPPNFQTDDWNLDDGTWQKIGYPLESSLPPAPLVHQWDLIAGETGPVQAMNDTPSSQAVAATMSKMAIGHRTPDETDGTIEPEEYVTYLMYKPPSGVWVALYKVEWSFGISMSKAGDGIWIRDWKADLVVNPSSAVGEWPSWIGRSSRAAVGYH